ncbi:DUF885 family protein [Asticcacaulis sp. YBE204]|uniref:DUF885 domain-containing protein n=1 Tax=Asticcacaulis sp. YBE204 TaxID=1282363 RepID=UPI0003C40BA5|nr:DUF885 family protein [Asticcacaulis sp. YBE204]ESQ78896.1 hypothetical protein AEYBE204_10760 [Asticcacaulis sp. YBE204]
MALALSIVPATGMAQATGEGARLKAIYSAEWTWRGAQQADSEETERGGIPDRLADVGPAAQKQRLEYWLKVRAKLQAIDQTALSPRERDDYIVYKTQIDALIDGQVFRDYEKPLNSDSAFWSDLAYGASGSFRTETDYRNYIKQLNDVPRYFDQNIDNMRAGLKRGFTPPKVTLTGREASIARVADAQPRDTVYFKPFLTLPSGFSDSLKADLQAQAEAAIATRVIPAHQKLLTFMVADYIPKARTGLAATGLPDGKAYYQAQIRAYTTLDLSPDEIHAIGLREVAKIRADMQTIMTEVGFKGSLGDFLTFLRTDPQFYAQTPQDLLYRAAWVSKRFDAKAGDYFGRLPRQRFGIYPVAPEIAPFYTSGRGGPGAYWVNTYDLKSRPLYSLPALTLHESAPGHAFQMPLSLENKDLADFRQRTYISAYGEGWALYAEYLGLEMGIYETPYERFGYLSYQMWRAARLVVDTGIHAKGWTREQAQAFMRDNTALSEHELTTEVDRYITWPGQALSYYLGYLTIKEARQRAETALGDRFDIRAFHDTILDLGSVPLPLVTARVERFITDGGKGPYAKGD